MITPEILVLALAAALGVATVAFSSSLPSRTMLALLLLTLVALVLLTLHVPPDLGTQPLHLRLPGPEPAV